VVKDQSWNCERFGTFLRAAVTVTSVHPRPLEDPLHAREKLADLRNRFLCLEGEFVGSEVELLRSWTEILLSYVELLPLQRYAPVSKVELMLPH
jgi:hypothetical protein